MHYFAYSPELDLSAFARWSASHSLPVADWLYVGPALLLDANLAFGSLDPAAGSGIATVRPAVGKRVAGAVYELPDDLGPQLDRFANAQRPFRESSAIRRVRSRGVALRRGDATTFPVVFHLDAEDVDANPLPTFAYIRSLIGFATRLGHSQGWIQHLTAIQTIDADLVPPMYDI